MIGPIIITLFVVAIVVGYMVIVNRMLRTDEYWNEANQAEPARKTAAPADRRMTSSLAHA